MAAFAFSGSAPAAVDEGAQPPAISSDKPDYAPGELVTLRGSNWSAGETVTIDVNDDAGRTWRRTVDVTADADGNVIDTFNLPDWFVAVYSVTATGSVSGNAATSFTDGNIKTASAAGRHFNYTATLYDGSSCTGVAKGAGSTLTADANGSTMGVGNNESLLVVANLNANAPNATATFSHWTLGTLQLAAGYSGTGRTICIIGFQSGSRDLIGNYTAPPANTAPAANNDAYSVSEDGSLTVTAPGVLGNDTDADGQALTAALVTGANYGTLTLNADGSFTYTPDADYFGGDSFSYRANDGFANSNLAAVSLTVDSVNDAPSFAKGADQTVAEDAGAQTVSPWATGISAGPANESGQALTFNTSNDNNSLFSAQPAIASNGTLTFTPAPNAHGSATVTVSLSDSGGTANGGIDTSAAQTFTITVIPVNDAPTCSAGSETTAEDGPKSLTLSCADVDGDSLSYTIVSDPAHGSLTGSGTSRTYSPDLDYHGSDSFTFSASDGALESNVATFDLTITPVDDPPVAVDDLASGVEDTSLVIDPADLLANDTDVDSTAAELSVTAVGTPSGGAVSFDGDGDIVFDPAENLCGGDVASFEYTVSDGAGSDAGLVTISLECVNDAPVVIAGSASVVVDEGDTAENSGTWFDVEGDHVTLGANVGTVTRNDDGTWSWSHGTTDGPAESATVTITADDGEDTDSVSFELTVENAAPSATFVAPASVDEGSDIALALNDPTDPSPVDTAAGFTYAFDCGSGYGPFGVGNTATCPTRDNGSRPVRGTVRDKDGGETEYAATVTVENVTPVVTAGADQAADEGTLTSFDLGSFVDPGADSPWSVTVDWGDGSSDTTFEFNAMAPFVASGDAYALALWEHAYDDNGPYTVTVTVTDKEGDFGSDTFEVAVANVAPSAVLGTGSPVDEGSPATVSFSGEADVSSADTAAGFRYAYDCDGGSFPTAPTYAGGSAAVSHECTFADNGIYTVSAAVIDKDDGYSVYETSVVVENVDPMVTAAAGQSGNEGEAASFDLGSFADPGTDSPWDVDVDWGDGSAASLVVTSAGFLPSALHTYDDDDTYTVTVTVTDKDGGSASATFEVTVENVAPAADFENNGPIDEGSAFQLELNSASDPSQADTSAGFEYAFDCGSGYGAFAASNTSSCPTEDNGTRTVKGKVKDKDGGETEYSDSVTIDNVDPTATLSNDGPADEGSAATVSFSDQADVSSADTAAGFRYAYDCDGGSFPTAPTYAGGSAAVSHECTFADNGIYTVSAAIIDKDDGYSVYETAVVVENVAPTAALGAAPETSPEGTEIGLTSSFTDPGSADTHTFAWSVTKNGSPFGSGGTGEAFSFTPDDNGSYAVTFTVTDDDGDHGSGSKTIAVTNVAPAATLGNNGPVDEGSSFTLSLTSASDPSAADSAAGFEYAFDCGSGYGSFSTTSTATCPTNDNGTRDVKGKIRDKDLDEREYTATVTVDNAAPSATLGNNGPVDEGSSFTLSLSAPSDPSSVDTAAGFTYAFDCGDGSGYGAHGATSTASCPTGDNGTRTVKGKIRDKDLGEREYTGTVQIGNVGPSVTITSPPYGTLYALGATVSVSASLSDPGTDDTHSCTVSWDDGLGSTPGTISEANGSGTCTGSRQLTAVGVYTIRVTVTDDDGGSGYDETLVVVFDPNVGHVTGGGWINSQAGAYVPDPTLAGRANFGFNARYLKGAKTPSGSTEFQFQAGSLNFRSTTYEWLVVSGAKGQFKGSGTINGAGGYGFLLTVRDGQLTGGGGTDTFRMKIWSITDGSIVYDNRPSSEDVDVSETQEIAGGSIVIHKGK